VLEHIDTSYTMQQQGHRIGIMPTRRIVLPHGGDICGKRTGRRQCFSFRLPMDADKERDEIEQALEELMSNE